MAWGSRGERRKRTQQTPWLSPHPSLGYPCGRAQEAQPCLKGMRPDVDGEGVELAGPAPICAVCPALAAAFVPDKVLSPSWASTGQHLLWGIPLSPAYEKPHRSLKLTRGTRPAQGEAGPRPEATGHPHGQDLCPLGSLCGRQSKPGAVTWHPTGFPLLYCCLRPG